MSLKLVAALHYESRYVKGTGTVVPGSTDLKRIYPEAREKMFRIHPGQVQCVTLSRFVNGL